jgi:hypothetical protein
MYFCEMLYRLQDSIEMFDGKQWSEWQKLPEARSGAACVFIPFYINKYFIENRYFNTLWVLGGWTKVKSVDSTTKITTSNRTLSDTVSWFDIQRRKWHRYPVALPKSLAFASAMFHNECIYVVGGIVNEYSEDSKNSLKPTADCWLLDLTLGKWMQVFTLQQPRSRISLMSIGNRLLAIGGTDANGWPTRHVEMMMNNGLGWCQQVDAPVAITGQQVVSFKIHDLPEPNLAGGEFTTEWQWRPEVLERVIQEAENLVNKKATTIE